MFLVAVLYFFLGHLGLGGCAADSPRGMILVEFEALFLVILFREGVDAILTEKRSGDKAR